MKTSQFISYQEVVWSNAFDNTLYLKIPFELCQFEGYTTICKTCNQLTDFASTNYRQKVGNVYQFVVECKTCKKDFVIDIDNIERNVGLYNKQLQIDPDKS